MPRRSAENPAYKELTLQQLRSFSETARLGSMAAAAKALRLTHPTVREQVLSLQRTFDAKLIEPYGRGCHLTDEGRLLAELTAPMVSGVAALRQRFDEARQQVPIRLVVAGPPRIVQEDLPRSLAALLERRPQVRVAFLEIRDDQVAAAVESGAADFGLTSGQLPTPAPPGLTFEPGYELEMLLLAPKKHPLARRRQVRPADLRRYPLITSRHTLADQPELAAIFERNYLFDGPPPRVEPFLASTVRRYVELGFGIGLVYGLLQNQPRSVLHERSMSHYFNRGLVRLVFRQGAAHEQLATEFAAIIRATNQRRLGKTGKRSP